MIKFFSLKTKKNKLGNSVFAFSNTFPEYDRTQSSSLREKALAQWQAFCAGESSELTHKYIAVLVSMQVDPYPKLLDYIFSRNTLDEEIVSVLLRQLHPLWQQNPFFHSLLRVREYLAGYQGFSLKLKHFKQSRFFLFYEDSPQQLADFLVARYGPVWADKPRGIVQVEKIQEIFQFIYREIYQRSLPDTLEDCIFPRQVLALFLQRIEPQLVLMDNFTRDFVLYPSLAKKPITKQVLADVQPYLTSRKKNLFTQYRQQLVQRYLPDVCNISRDDIYLNRLEKVAESIYQLYPIDYQTASSLLESSFVSSVLEELVSLSWSTLLLSRNFMQDLCLRSRYPQYTKLIGLLIQKHQHQWQQNATEVKDLYLQQLLRKSLPVFANLTANKQYIRLLEREESAFRQTYHSLDNLPLYQEMGIQFLQRLIDHTVPSLHLCPCKEFFSDFRLKSVSAQTPMVTRILQNYDFDKTGVFIQYIYAFHKGGLFAQINETGNAFVKCAMPHKDSIREKDPQAALLLIRYYNLQQIIYTFSGDRLEAEERRDFWLKMNHYSDGECKVYQAKDRLLFLAQFGNKLVLDSTKYAEACYVYYDVTPIFLDQQIQHLLTFRKSKLRPLDVAPELSRQQVRHITGWQQKLQVFLLPAKYRGSYSPF